MTRLTLELILIYDLKQKLTEDSMAYMKKNEAYLALKKYIGQDFGDDADKWQSGLKSMVYLFYFLL